MTPKDITDFKRILLDTRPWLMALTISTALIALALCVLVWALLNSHIIPGFQVP